MEHPAEGKPIGPEPSYVTGKRHGVAKKEPFFTHDDPHRKKPNGYWAIPGKKSLECSWKILIFMVE